MEKKWEEMTAGEKRKQLFHKWQNPDVKFKNAAAQKAYQERTQRLKDAIEMKVPDRVPVFPMIYPPGSILLGMPSSPFHWLTTFPFISIRTANEDLFSNMRA